MCLILKSTLNFSVLQCFRGTTILFFFRRSYAQSPVLLFLSVLVAGSAFAQEPAEFTSFLCRGNLAGALPTIDGDHSDWAWVDKSFEVTIDDMNPLTGGADDADDLFVDLMIGWSDANNCKRRDSRPRQRFDC